MSSQLRYVLTYEQMVAAMLAAHPEDEAMARSVGGHYERFGVLEHALLRACGLRPSSSVIDVGCGSGRLASQLSRYPRLTYLGTDVVPALLDYARRRAGRAEFRFEVVDRPQLPAADASADFVLFFSVFTHLLHEESYVYLAEARRVLRPGGRAVFSFLELAVAHNWTVFDANVAWVRDRTMAGHLNVFQHRDDIRLWAERLGFEVAAFHGGDAPWIQVDAAAATEGTPAGPYALGQSVCVLRVPARVRPPLKSPARQIIKPPIEPPIELPIEPPVRPAATPRPARAAPTRGPRTAPPLAEEKPPDAAARAAARDARRRQRRARRESDPAPPGRPRRKP